MPVPMSSQAGLSYLENFDVVASWTANFAAGAGASRFDSVVLNATGVIPDGKRITTSTAVFASGTGGGAQQPAGCIVLLSTGPSPENSTACAIDFFMDFTGVNAGTLSLDWAVVFNSTGDRAGSLRVYWSTDGTAFTEITAAQVLNKANNVAANGSVTAAALPSAFNNRATARLRFYECNGTGGTTGNRAKISIDNLAVTASAACQGKTAPAATTGVPGATNTLGFTATGILNANNAVTAVTFEYGPTADYGNTVTAGESPVSGAGDMAVSAPISGLRAGTPYHYRVKAVNAGGTSYGDDQSVTTLALSVPVIAGWDLSGLADYGASPLAATIATAHATVGGVTRGSGVGTTGKAAGSAWGGVLWTNTSAAAAISATNFATCAVKANTGYTVSFTSISKFDYRRSDTGPTDGVLQYSLDGSTFADITAVSYSSSADSGSSIAVPIALAGIAALQNVANAVTVTFRIVNWGATGATGSWYLFDRSKTSANDFEISGVVTAAQISPMTVFMFR